MCFPPGVYFSSLLIIPWSPSNCPFTFGHLQLASSFLSYVTLPFLQSSIFRCGTHLFLKGFLGQAELFSLTAPSLEIFKNLPGQGPVQPAVGDPASAGGLD